jgi:hypothetical protein
LKNIKVYALFLSTSIFITGCGDGLVELDGNQSSILAKKIITTAGVNNDYNPTVVVYSYYKKPNHEYAQSIVVINDASKRAGISKSIDGDSVIVNLKTDKNITTKKFIVKAIKLDSNYYLRVDEKTTTYKANEIIRDAEIIILNSDNCAKNGWK